MTTLVTGATGNVGSALVGELMGRGAHVRAFVRSAEKARSMLGADVDVAVGDFSDQSSLLDALVGVDAVFLACGNDPRQVEYETSAIDVLAKVAVPRVVKVSAIGAERGSRLGFWDWQGRIEEHLRESNLPATVLRAHFFMSNVLASADSVKAAGSIFLPARDAALPMVDPRDVAAVAAAVLTGDAPAREVVDVTGPEVVTFADVAETLSVVLGRPVAYVDVPDDAARTALLDAGAPEWMADNLLTLFDILRTSPPVPVTDAVERITGRRARTFAEFARDHAAAFAA